MHGGANIAFAESLGSCLSNILVAHEGKSYYKEPISILITSKVKTRGTVTGTARMIRKGQTLHFLKIEIKDENGSLLCHSTMTNMVINRKIEK